jgi:hypothetical protein
MQGLSRQILLLAVLALIAMAIYAMLQSFVSLRL